MNFSLWLSGARPHTWANAIAPVCAGSAAALYYDSFSPLYAFLALLVSWFLIIGVNYANDYSDGIRGTDDQRTGPQRLTGGGLVPAAQVKKAAFFFLGLAGLVGAYISITTHPWMLIVGALCILAAWFYTGGSRPYGYRGLGEVAVFIFFGLVAVLGTEYIQRDQVSLLGLGLAVGIGSLSASVNLVNNLRDIPEDKEAGKITLAVRLGDSRTRVLYMILNTIPFIMSLVWACLNPYALVGFIAFPFSFAASKPIRTGAQGKALIPVLGLTGRAMLIWSVAAFFIAVVF